MKYLLAPLAIVFVLLACNSKKQEMQSPSSSNTVSNMSDDVMTQLAWFNRPASFGIKGDTLYVTTQKGSDFFNSPEDMSVVATAPLLYQEMTGDFVVRALVQPDFSAQWNAVALMVHLDSLNWIKFAFENSDATGPSIVSVVTKGTSDDANGARLAEDAQIWLAIIRKDHIYSMHWSTDGENFKMARLTAMPEQRVVRLGLEMQSPVGDSAIHQVHYFETQNRTVDDLRNLRWE